MKNSILVSLLTFFVSQTVIAQHDAAIFVKVPDGKVKESVLIPWYVYSGEKVFLDIRYNFDWANTATFMAGKTFTVKKGWDLTPAVGFMFGGEYDAFIAELNLFKKFGKKGKASIFNIVEYGATFSREQPDVFYQFGSLMWKPKRWLQFGVEEQVYFETNPMSEATLDIGPAVKFFFSNFYVKIWPTYDPISSGHPQKTFIGLGFNL